MGCEDIARIKARIACASQKSGREPAEVTIVGVTKGRTVEEVRSAIEAGVVDIGENRVQEALLKYNSLRPSASGLHPIIWHMVGHLQTNKAKDAVRIFDLIHSVDSLRLAREIDLQAAKISKVQDILLEVKTSPEATKFGFVPEETAAATEEIRGLGHIKVKGLMTIAPPVDNPEQARPYFRKLKEMRDEIEAQYPIPYTLRVLSMGMSDDFEVAIEEGATMVRLGRAIFGDY